MKNILYILVLLSLTVTGVCAMNFDEALSESSSTPAAVLLYADWADNVQEVVQAFSLTEQQYSDKYNFVKLNIASKDTKSFNKICPIMTNLPYVILLRDGVKFMRVIRSDCVTSSSCFSGKLDAFDR